MIIPLDAKLEGIKCTVGALGEQLGTHLHVCNVGPLRRDGRRKADQALATNSTGNVSTVLKKTRRERAMLIRRQELAATRAVDPKLVQPIQVKAAARAAELENQARHELENAVRQINVATVDCEVDENTIPWLLAYAKMLRGDEGVDIMESDI